ncbi:hypothetical protein [Paenibacillus sp. NPDC057934]|uniref:hypothetical protein n=1 Tax=Paenibacillus sp. NPDC057934 TaxID=3346282 RepID=UPI0036DD87C7
MLVLAVPFSAYAQAPNNLDSNNLFDSVSRPEFGPNAKAFGVTLITAEQSGGISVLTTSQSPSVTVPINVNGNQGNQAGQSFIISEHNSVKVLVNTVPSNMSTVNIGIVDVTTGASVGYMPNVSVNKGITYNAGSNANHTFKVLVSTNESVSKTANFSIESYNQ